MTPMARPSSLANLPFDGNFMGSLQTWCEVSCNMFFMIFLIIIICFIISKNVIFL